MILRAATILLAQFFFSTAFSQGLKIRGVEFPGSVEVSNSKLVLNGVGLRTATIFKVGVYAAGLYLSKPDSSATSILNSTGPKILQMHFLRKVEAEKIRNAWDESFEANCKIDCEQGNKHLEQLKTALPTMEKGQQMTYEFQPDLVRVSVEGKQLITIHAASFARTLLSTWIGDNPPNESLRNGLLGKPD